MKTPPRRVLRLVGVPVLFAVIYIAVGLRFGVWGLVAASAVWVVWLLGELIAGDRKRRASAREMRGPYE